MSVDAALVSQTPGLDYVTFSWNGMTANGFVEKWKQEGSRKVDFIHMLEVGVTIMNCF